MTEQYAALFVNVHSQTNGLDCGCCHVQVPKAHLSALLLMLAAVIVTSVTATLQLTCGTWEVRTSCVL